VARTGILVDPAVIDFGVFEFPEEPDDPQFLTSTFSVYNASLESMYLQGRATSSGATRSRCRARRSRHARGSRGRRVHGRLPTARRRRVRGKISLNLGDANVELRGEAHAPRLEVQDTLQISTPYRCAQHASLRVQNIGHDPLTLDLNDFSTGGPAVRLSWTSDEHSDLRPGRAPSSR
jgi:hypothetical protein